VFTRTGTTWSQQAHLTAADGRAFDLFGCSVALAGDTAVVGAIGGNVDQGLAYVFTRTGTAWSQQAQLTAADGTAIDLFGVSVAVSGDTAVVGADNNDLGVNVDQGSAYVFTRTGTAWSQQAQLTAADGAAIDLFGVSVAVSGDTAVVGADSDDVDGNTNQGSVYVFTDIAPLGSTLSIGDVAHSESDAGARSFSFAVTLSAPSLSPMTVSFATRDKSATAASDYLATSGSLTFAPGQTLQRIRVTVTGDTESEPDETFVVRLFRPSGAVVADGTGVGTILNDD
jgi:hypothetical protein